MNNKNKNDDKKASDIEEISNKEKHNFKLNNIINENDTYDEELISQSIDKKTDKKRKYIKYAGWTLSFVIAILTFFAFKNGYFVKQEKFSALLSKLGIFGPIIFIIIQTFFTVFPFNPTAITNVAVVLAYGPVMGYILNYIPIMIGSTINFFLGRKYGKKFIGLLFSEEAIDKQIHWLNKNNRIMKMFIIVLIVPFLPDDLSCMIVGMTNMKFKHFFIVTAIIKIWSLGIFLYLVMNGYSSLYQFIFR